MGKKKFKKARSSQHTCSECRNFQKRGAKKGYCARKEKKRRHSEEACGHFDPA